ncbi:hypothetical protein E1294_43970 [Nonomuraea diastatica]|uniref:Uncharacterized protein n=1 Tax=Nonomuraea diastatica TaxID=1848329 RepID=A0A4V2YCN8_9ACTN|nr:hypothetical protein E1294_43970 [Nonomuraea diastatica]
MRTRARMLDVPSAIVDATALTEAGHVGEDVENVLYDVPSRDDVARVVTRDTVLANVSPALVPCAHHGGERREKSG